MMRARCGVLVLALFPLLLAGCVGEEKTRTLKLDVSISDDHKMILIRNDGPLSIENVVAHVYARNGDDYSFPFPAGTPPHPPGKTAKILLESFKMQDGTPFTDWNKIYRIQVYTDREYWSGGGTGR